ncbi:FmdE family protein [Candidatus Pyrohabitans sp.]
MDDEMLRRAVEFHGHLCPFVVVGAKAAGYAMQQLDVERAGDEELFCIAETANCAIDAIQAIAGCTVGKGNLYIRDYGKSVFIFGSRKNGRALRLYFNPELLKGRSMEEKVKAALSLSPEEAFTVDSVRIEFPEEAEVRDSVRCSACGEYAMDTKVREVNGKKLCLPCYFAAREEEKTRVE